MIRAAPHAYLETDTAAADRETIIRNFISGQYETPVRVVAFNTAEGWSRDASEIAHEVLDRVIETRTSHSRDSLSRLDLVPRPFERLHDCLRLSDRCVIGRRGRRT